MNYVEFFEKIEEGLERIKPSDNIITVKISKLKAEAAEKIQEYKSSLLDKLDPVIVRKMKGSLEPDALSRSGLPRQYITKYYDTIIKLKRKYDEYVHNTRIELKNEIDETENAEKEKYKKELNTWQSAKDFLFDIIKHPKNYKSEVYEYYGDVRSNEYDYYCLMYFAAKLNDIYKSWYKKYLNPYNNTYEYISYITKLVLEAVPQTRKSAVDWFDFIEYILTAVIDKSHPTKKHVLSMVRSNYVSNSELTSNRVSAAQDIAENIEEINDLLTNNSDGRFFIVKSTGGSLRTRAMITVIDKTNKLQLTLNKTDLLKFNAGTKKDDINNLIDILDNLFNEHYGDLIKNRKNLSTDTIFCYKQDAVVAVDPAVLGPNKENVQRGGQIGAIATDNVICHFINPNDTSDSDSECYYNEIIDKKTIRVYGIKPSDLDRRYTDINKIHAFFEIVGHDTSLSSTQYKFFGEYIVKNDSKIVKLPEDKYIEESGNTYTCYLEYENMNADEVLSEKLSNAQIADLIEEASKVISKHGYGITRNIADIVEARMIAERNGYRVKKIR